MAPLQENRGQPNWLQLPAVITVVLALGVLKLVIAGRTGLSFDEGYYTLWSYHLAPGYLDHPPMVALMIAAGRAILGDNELGVRLFAILSVLITSATIYRTGILVFDRASAGLAVIWYNLALPSGLGLIITPDSPSIMFWTLTVWAVVEFVHGKNPNWWLAVGAFAGLGLLSKYTGAFLGPGLLLLFLSTPTRRQWFGIWQVWAGAVLALMIVSPNLWWNAQHNWASIWFQGRRTITPGLEPGFLANFGDLVAGQIGFMGPVLMVAALLGVGRLLVKSNGSDRTGAGLIAWTSLPLLAYFIFHTVHARVEANWLGPVWPLLALVAAQFVLAIRTLWLKRALIALQVIFTAGLIGVISAQFLFQPFQNPSIDRTNETRGWPQLQRAIADLAQAHGAKWIATAGDYSVTGELASYFSFARSPLAVRQIDAALRYIYLPPLSPANTHWPAVLVLRGGPQALNRYKDFFSSIEPLGTLTRHQGTEMIETYWAYLAAGPRPDFYKRANAGRK